MKKTENRFVVHEHYASRLHWDFRLEMTENLRSRKLVLKSWAVPKGPPTNENERRLAVQTPDHDVSYINFKGNIPEGVYGAGEVKIWDEGTYTLEKRTENEYKFILFGKQLKGSFALFHPKSFNKGQFLFLKHKHIQISKK